MEESIDGVDGWMDVLMDVRIGEWMDVWNGLW